MRTNICGLWVACLFVYTLNIDTAFGVTGQIDATPPLITLKWNGPMVIRKGEKPVQPLVYARDEKDGDLTNRIKIKSNVNIKKTGKYKIVYSVDNLSGKRAKDKTLTVIVISVDPSRFYYVTPSGNDTENDGCSEKNAWRTITYAAKQATPGDTVYVKAGVYKNERVEFANSGTASAPIIFEGYKRKPGDLSFFKWTYGDSKYSLGLNSRNIPTLVTDDRIKSIAFYIHDKQYIRIRNFQIKHYSYCLVFDGINAKYDEADNIYCEDLGMRPSTHSYGHGRGFEVALSANHIIIRNSIVLNAEIEAFNIGGFNNIVDSCKAYGNYSDALRDGTDYYFIVHGVGIKVSNSLARRKYNLPHGGHGFTFKKKDSNCWFVKCHAHDISESFQFRHHLVMHNVIADCVATGDRKNAARGVFFRDGASYNRVVNFKAFGLTHAFMFQERNEDPGNKNGYASSHNIVENSVVEKNIAAFILINPSLNKHRNGKALNTIFRNVVFSGNAKWAETKIFYAYLTPLHMRFINCTFKNVVKYCGLKPVDKKGEVLFINPKFKNVDFKLPSDIIIRK